MFARRVGDEEVCVVTYHGVLPEGWTPVASPIEGTLLSAERFRRHLRFLKSRYNLISPVAFHSWLKEAGSVPPRAVLLTCDDGFLNVLTDMVPILVEEGAQCLFFVTGASLEDAPESLWYEELHRMLDDARGDAPVALGSEAVRKDSLTAKKLDEYWRVLMQQLSALDASRRKEALGSLRVQWGLPIDWRMYDPGDAKAARRYRLLNQSELKQVATAGMSIGAHTLSHPMLPKMSTELAEHEIRDCKARLEGCVQQEVWALAYPFGDEGSAAGREIKIAEGAGYACAFLNCGGGLSRRTSPRFALPRAHVTSEMDVPELEAHLSGFHEALQRGFRGASGSR